VASLRRAAAGERRVEHGRRRRVRHGREEERDRVDPLGLEDATVLDDGAIGVRRRVTELVEVGRAVLLLGAVDDRSARERQ
jgi:hypothetical protein